jgi:hypothetical protein
MLGGGNPRASPAMHALREQMSRIVVTMPHSRMLEDYLRRRTATALHRVARPTAPGEYGWKIGPPTSV